MTERLLKNLRGPFNFLEPGARGLEALHESVGQLLPPLRPLHPARKGASPLYGYPVLMTRALAQVRSTCAAYLHALERAQVIEGRRQTLADRQLVERTWEAYRQPLAAVSENLMTANYGRGLPQIFWLLHSLDLARILRGSVGRARALHPSIDRQRGEALRYHVLFRYLDRVFSMLYELASQLALRTYQRQEALFPKLLVQMRDNVLIFTEDHIGRDLAELSGYFRGYVNIDGPQFLYRLALLRQWHQQVFSGDPTLRAAAEALIGERITDADSPLNNAPYLKIVAAHRAYDESALMPRAELELWGRLLEKLKEFEFLNAARRLVVELQPQQSKQLVCDGRSASRLGGGSAPIVFDPKTRPLDFGAPWVVDPSVDLVGLVYDIKDFSEQLLALHRSDRAIHEEGLRRVFVFQQRLNLLAEDMALRWEKHLGDGALYTASDPWRALVTAIAMQRIYRSEVENGFLFNHGLRIGLNFGSYRQLPLGPEGGGEHYEIFGYGLVELTRLVSGKKGLDVEEIVSTLVNHGYQEHQARDFFVPFQDAEVDLERPRQGGFAAQLTGGGTLINEGIVATQSLLMQLENPNPGSDLRALYRSPELPARVLVPLGELERQPLVAGIRRLGEANFKGLGRIPIYDIVDASDAAMRTSTTLPHRKLLRAIDEAYMTSLAGS